jgi:hypothetical protein
MRDAGRQDVVEGGDPVRGNEKKTVAVEAVYVSDFTAGMKLEIWEFGMKKDGVEEVSAHGKKFYR